MDLGSFWGFFFRDASGGYLLIFKDEPLKGSQVASEGFPRCLRGLLRVPEKF